MRSYRASGRAVHALEHVLGPISGQALGGLSHHERSASHREVVVYNCKGEGGGGGGDDDDDKDEYDER